MTSPSESDMRALIEDWEAATGNKAFHHKLACYQDKFKEIGPWAMLYKAVEPLHKSGQHVNCVACLALERIRKQEKP